MTWICQDCDGELGLHSSLYCDACLDAKAEDKRRAALTEAGRRYEACSKRPVDELPQQVEGQESLI